MDAITCTNMKGVPLEMKCNHILGGCHYLLAGGPKIFPSIHPENLINHGLEHNEQISVKYFTGFTHFL